MLTTVKPNALCALLALIGAAPAAAEETDVQYWIDSRISWSLDENTSGLLEFSPRFSRDSVREDELLTRLTIRHAPTAWLAFGGGFTLLENSGAGRELRPHQDIVLTFKGVSLQSRLEQRQFDQGRPSGLRLREAIGYGIPLGDKNSLSLSAEAFFRLKQQGALDKGFEQVWLTADFRHKLTPQAQIGVGYRLIYVDRSGEDAISHVPRLLVNYAF